MTAPVPKPSYTSLLKNRAFSYLWAGQLISQSGDAIFDVALLWLVFVSTGSTALVGITDAAALLPAVLATPIAGVLADRANRRDVMVASILFQGAVTAIASALYVEGMLSFPILLVLVLVLYTGAVFYRTSSSAIVPAIVSKEHLGAANGLFSLSTSANQLVSFSVGGLVILALGLAFPITSDSLTFFAAAALLMLVAKSYGRPRLASTPSPTGDRGFWKEFREGLRYVRSNRTFLQLAFFGLFINAFGSALFAILAPYAKTWVHGDASTYGFILSSFALGSMVGSLLIGRVNFRAYVGKLLFFGIILAGLLLVLVGLVTTVLPALVLFFASGAALACVNIPLNAWIDGQIPREMLGRANSVLNSLLSATQPVAAVLGGVLAGVAAIGSVVTGLGVAMAAVTVVLYPLFKELRGASY